MALPKPANRPRLKIGGDHRARLHDRVQKFLHPVRPAQTVTISSGAGKIRIGEAVRIVAGAAKGQSGVVVFSGGGVAYVRCGADLIKVLADYLTPITSSTTTEPRPV